MAIIAKKGCEIKRRRPPGSPASARREDRQRVATAAGAAPGDAARAGRVHPLGDTAEAGGRAGPDAAAPAARPAPVRSPAPGGATRRKAGRFSTRRQAAGGAGPAPGRVHSYEGRPGVSRRFGAYRGHRLRIGVAGIAAKDDSAMIHAEDIPDGIVNVCTETVPLSSR